MEHIAGGDVETKTLFFEGNPVDYSKAGMDMDLNDLQVGTKMRGGA